MDKFWCVICSVLNPIVGNVSMVSRDLTNLYNIVVFPAASRPKNTIRAILLSLIQDRLPPMINEAQTSIHYLDNKCSDKPTHMPRDHPFKKSVYFPRFLILTPLPSAVFYYYPSANLANFLPLPPKECRRLKWMVP